MNRIATRAMAMLVLVLVLVGGIGFFLGEYFAKAEEWVLFSGSPHVYSNGRLGTGVITDRSGVILVDLTDGRSYTGDPLLRKAMLHWVGDRQGNISVPYISHYTDALLGYDPVAGLYRYGENEAQILLTLSADIQTAALEAMGDRVGTVAVYNYRTGQLLCAVSTPTFDPDNVPNIASDTTGAYTGVYLNRFLQSKYIPGSIFKIVTLAAALESVPDIEQKSFRCNGVYEIGGGDVTCMRAHGEQSLKEAFRNSCNCAFAQITHLVGRENMEKYVEAFGVTSPVSFDGTTTVSGNFDLENASQEQIAWSGIGQHKDQINPCAYLAFLGAIAGEGTGAMPYVVDSVRIGAETTYRAETVKASGVLSPETAAVLADYMESNVSEKYGAENFPGLTVCAKSGTGEVGGGKKPNAMFAGFLRDEAYPFAFIVAIQEGGFGAEVCVPILSPVLAACKEAADQGGL